MNVSVPDELVEELAERVAAKVAERLPAPAQDGYLGVDEAAEHLACPRSRIYDLISLGRLSHFRDGRRLLFRYADLDAVLERAEAS